MKWHKIDSERGTVLPIPNKLVLIRLKPVVIQTSWSTFTNYGSPVVLGEYEVGDGWRVPGFSFAEATHWCDCLELTSPAELGLLPDYSIKEEEQK